MSSNVEDIGVIDNLFSYIISMESKWASSSYFLQNISNDRFSYTNDTPLSKTDCVSIAIVTLSSLGLPGILRVTAVCMRTMTSSIIAVQLDYSRSTACAV